MRFGTSYRVLDEDEGLATPPPVPRTIHRRRAPGVLARRARFVAWMLSAVLLVAGFAAAIIGHQPALALLDGLGLVAVAKILTDKTRLAPPPTPGEKPLAGPGVVWRRVARLRPS